MNISSYLSPLTIGATASGLLFAGALLTGIYQGRRTISTQLKKAGETLFSQVGFFTIVILVFLVISVLESGQFFNVNITHEALFGILGYALALGFDLVSVVCMLARMSAIRMRDVRGAHLNLLGVILCAAVSAFANAAASLQGYQASNLDRTPWWMQQVAPWLGTVFPTMIVVLSLTTDHLLDHRGPAKGVDLDKYKAQEKRRVDMLQIKLDTEKELLKLDRELATLRTQRGQASGPLPREWSFMSWIRPVTPPTQEMIAEKVEQAVDTSRQALDTQISQLQTLFATVDTRLDQLTERIAHHEEVLITLHERISNLATLTTDLTAHLTTLDRRVTTLAEQMEAMGIRMDMLNSTVHTRLSTPESRTNRDMITHHQSNGHTPRSRQTIKLDTRNKERDSSQEREKGERVALEERILAAQRTLGPGASNRQIARVVNCSPTTVAKWLAQRENAQEEQEPA